MLDYAYFNQSELYDLYKKKYEEEEQFFFFLSYPQKDFFPRIYPNDSDFLQFVSKDKNDNILGYISGKINHEYQLLQHLEILNFTGKPNIVFSKDVFNYFDKAFFYKNLRKIDFTCVERNPALKCYRKFVKKVNGHEIGIQINEIKLSDGNYYNNVLFEIYREEYLKTMKK